MTIKQLIIATLAVCVLMAGVKVLAVNEAKANEFRASQSAEPTVIGHRIDGNGNFQLVTK